MESSLKKRKASNNENTIKKLSFESQKTNDNAANIINDFDSLNLIKNFSVSPDIESATINAINDIKNTNTNSIIADSSGIPINKNTSIDSKILESIGIAAVDEKSFNNITNLNRNINTNINSKIPDAVIDSIVLESSVNIENPDNVHNRSFNLKKEIVFDVIVDVNGYRTIIFL